MAVSPTANRAADAPLGHAGPDEAIRQELRRRGTADGSAERFTQQARRSANRRPGSGRQRQAASTQQAHSRHTAGTHQAHTRQAVGR